MRGDEAMTQTHTPKPGTTVNPFLVCPDLETLERPRYFAGQLLTAEELNSEQTYIAAKQRLHHRYLHGPRGRIVAGLQVAKSDNPGFVNIAAGYAIDYCGNDIVVPKVDTFNVLEQIRANANELGYARSAVWNPATATAKDGAPVSPQQMYWLTISYAEQEARPANVLRQSVVASSSKRKDSGCGSAQSGTTSTTQSASTMSITSKPGNSPTVCEPTRIREVYSFDVVAADATTALSDARLTGDNRLVLARITVQNGDIVQIENDVAARQAASPPLPQAAPSALTDLQNTVTALQDALQALQDEITLLKAAATPVAAEPTAMTPAAMAPPPVAEPTAATPVAMPTTPPATGLAATTPAPSKAAAAPSSEIVQPPAGEEKSGQPAELEAKPPDNAAPEA
jgi:hypothetical protein